MLLTVACPEPAQTPVDLIEKIILCEANYGHFKGCCHLGPQGFGEHCFNIRVVHHKTLLGKVNSWDANASRLFYVVLIDPLPSTKAAEVDIKYSSAGAGESMKLRKA